jgi:hypothetical protein
MKKQKKKMNNKQKRKKRPDTPVTNGLSPPIRKARKLSAARARGVALSDV